MKLLAALALAWGSALAADPVLNVQVGPRPYYLVAQMAPSPLKDTLMRCAESPLARSDFSISHRGAPLQFPEHTRQGYVAAARMGAGILECDVTFTADGELVCRHAQCDLHATTDILQRPKLRGRCRVPPRLDAAGNLTNAADVLCCATDVSVAEFKSLCGKMEGYDREASSIDAALAATPGFRTDLYSTCGTLMTHAESVQLFKALGVKSTPELKGVHRDATGAPLLPSDGFGASGLDRARYASKLIDTYRALDVPPTHVFPQSFDLQDVLHWIDHDPAYARQAVYLVGQRATPDFAALRARGVRILGVPTARLLALNGAGAIGAADYAHRARAAGLELIAWTAERSGRLREDANGDFYYAPIAAALEGDGQVMEIIHALAQEAGVRGIFSDWPGTVTYYANCLSR